jgi:sensor histidine kinase YesM
MIQKADSANSMKFPCEEEEKRSFVAGFFKAVWIAPAVAGFIVILYLVLGNIRLSQMGYRFLESLCYSSLIGFPSAIALTWISVRYTDRFPRMVILMQVFTLLCTATLGSLCANLLLGLLGGISKNQIWPEFYRSLPFAMVITMVVGLSITSFETMRYKLQATQLELRTRQVEKERAYKLMAEAQLSSLESRIHPHFLFNTLNSIAALIPSDPQRAEDTVGKLASLLRFSLGAQNRGLVSLQQELKIVRDYLEIEKTRFGARLNYEIEVPSELEDLSVPPLALQSLVENSVKHVVSQRTQGSWIRVTGASESGRILLVVEDDGPGFSMESITPEHGLGNLQARLGLLYPNQGKLEVARENDKTIVRMTFPAE